MKNKIVNAFLILFFIFWTVGSVYLGHRIFPSKIELPPEIIKPTAHELNKLAQQIAEPEIQKAKEYWENKAPITITIQGADSIHYETKEIYPKGTINISKRFDWNMVFENTDRLPDSLSFSTLDSLEVTAYYDSLGSSFIGYSDFSQTIDKFMLSVHPKIYREDLNETIALYLGTGFQISNPMRLNEQNISKEGFVGLEAQIGVLLYENWFIGLNAGIDEYSHTYGINISRKIFSFKRK